MSETMTWQQLLTVKRLNSSNSNRNDSNIKENVRSPFLRDIDKITFSSYFRKLQDKTQVHPLAKNSYVRTRLTHSLEVATVGRSLGVIVGNEILKKHGEILVENDNNPASYSITAADFAYIVQAASLAHDIGNPPFGHKGEDIISSFYKDLLSSQSDLFNNALTDEEQNNFTNFDGNAEGFRIIANIADHTENKLGLNLTYPVLSTFCKYPSFIKDSQLINAKKVGVFVSEKEIFLKLTKTLQLIEENSKNCNTYKRHPLTYLLEAADDICYCIADIQDAFSVGVLSFSEVEDLFKPFLFSKQTEEFYELANKHNYSFTKDLNLEKLQAKQQTYLKLCANYNLKQTFIIEHLASDIINILIHATALAFLENEQALLAGSLNEPLLKVTLFYTYIKQLRTAAENKIYTYKEKSKQELSGMAAIKNILNEFTNIAIEIEQLKRNAQKEAKALVELEKLLNSKSSMLNRVYLDNKLSSANDLYTNLQIINDFIVNSTDKNIIDIYHTITAIA